MEPCHDPVVFAPFPHPAAWHPRPAGRSVVVGDYEGFVHFLSREDGTVLARMKTDGSAISAAPVIAGQTLVVQTRDGDVYGFVPN